nr:MAG: cytochrome c-type biogenesis protein CcmH [Hyphomicrobiales bacterium]
MALSIALAITASSANAAYDEALPDTAQEARARSLFRELRCLVCQCQSIDESNADLAADLRRIVRAKIAEGDSDEAIKTFLVDRYGVFVLMRPPVRGDTYLLWFGPALLLLLGGAMVWGIIGRARRRAAVVGEEAYSEEWDDGTPGQ